MRASARCATRSSLACDGRGRRPAAPCACGLDRSSGWSCRSPASTVNRRHAWSRSTASPLPLQPTGTGRIASAACATSAWQPAAAHPTIGTHAPLTFDIGRPLDAALAGRLPLPRGASGRRNYEVFPVNAYEAESRRPGALLPPGHTRRARWTVAGAPPAGVPVHAGPASARSRSTMSRLAAAAAKASSTDAGAARPYELAPTAARAGPGTNCAARRRPATAGDFAALAPARATWRRPGADLHRPGGAADPA